MKWIYAMSSFYYDLDAKKSHRKDCGLEAFQ